jgi:predicted signal transduction protein with EAL and GGDEF domain
MRPLRVLIVEDSPDDAMLLQDALSEAGLSHGSKIVQTAEALRSALSEGHWDIVISDHSMPQFDSSAALAIVRAADDDLPFIIVSGTIDEETAVEAMRAGAQDYLFKGNLARLPAAVTREVEEASVRRNRREAEARIHYLAHYDTPTGLHSRPWLLEQLGEMLLSLDGSLSVVVVVGLESLADVSEAFGQGSSDAALSAIAHRLSSALTDLSAIVGRVGEDRIACVYASSKEEDIERHVGEIAFLSGQPLELEGNRLWLMSRVGYAVSRAGETSDTSALLRYAEIALERARQNETQSCKYSRPMSDEKTSRLLLLADLEQAVRDNELKLVFQPQVFLKTGKIKGLEALVRWTHREHGAVPTEIFIPLAERTGLITAVTDWVLEAVALQQLVWRSQGNHVPVAINVSAHDLQEGSDLAGRVEEKLAKHGLAGEALAFEVTEGTLVAHRSVAVRALKRLLDLGARTSIDDFGTGYSSLSYLLELPVQELKMDRSFVSAASDDERARYIVESVTRLGARLGLDVVAEGVEDQSTLNLLKDIGCPAGQGYLICRPLAAGDVEPWLVTNHGLSGRSGSQA